MGTGLVPDLNLRLAGTVRTWVLVSLAHQSHEHDATLLLTLARAGKQTIRRFEQKQIRRALILDVITIAKVLMQPMHADGITCGESALAIEKRKKYMRWVDLLLHEQEAHSPLE